MNWILICVLGILIINIAEGYHKGFVRIMFSLVALVVTLIFVSVATPYITTYIEEHTTIDEKITARCLEHIEKNAEEKMQEQAQEQLQNENGDTGLMIPADLLDKIADTGSSIINDSLEESGVYNNMAKGLAHFIISGMSFFLAFIIIIIILHLIINALDLVAKLPILKGVNHLLGLVAGLIKGLLIIWLFMYLITICATSSFGTWAIDYINRNEFLSFMYEHNFIMMFFMKIF